LRAEVETTLDGTTVLALSPGKAKTEGRKAETIEIIGSVPRGPDVNVVLAGKPRGRRDEPTAPGRRPSTRRPGRQRVPGDGTSGRGRNPDRGATDEEGRGRGPSGPKRERSRTGTRRDGPRRLTPSSTFRNAALATLRPEQLPVAEQLLRGGIPAVRQAIEEQNGRARAEGRPADAPAEGVAADALAPRRVGELVFPITQAYVEDVVLVDDASILAAQRALWQAARIAAEPAASVGIAALLTGAYKPAPGERVAVVISGANMAPAQLDA
jgi:hypothetical protein